MSNDMYYDNESNFRNLTQETSFKKDSKAVRVPFSVVSQQITESRKVEEHLFSLKTLLKALKRKLIFLQLEISEIKNCIHDKNEFEFRIRERIYTSKFELFSIPHPQQSTLNSTSTTLHVLWVWGEGWRTPDDRTQPASGDTTEKKKLSLALCFSKYPTNIGRNYRSYRHESWLKIIKGYVA